MRWGFVANTELETGRAPIDELNCAFRLDYTNSRIHILGNDIATEKESAGH